MRYKGLVSNGYVVGFVSLPDGVLSEEQVQNILSTKPEAEEGYAYRLKEDYTWELYTLPEPEEEEATEEDYKSALNQLGVSTE